MLSRKILIKFGLKKKYVYCTSVQIFKIYIKKKLTKKYTCIKKTSHFNILGVL